VRGWEGGTLSARGGGVVNQGTELEAVRVRGTLRKCASVGALVTALVSFGISGASANSALATAGSGAADGSVQFQQPFPSGCCSFGTDAWTVTGSGTVNIANTGITDYPGPINIVGNGSSASASLAGESGAITISVNGQNGGGGFLYCDGTNSSTQLSGGYTRFLSIVVVDVKGTCNMNFWIGPDEFIAAGQFMPDPTKPGNGNGITGPVQYGIFAVGVSFSVPIP
jgi:hypothetical protein